MRSRIRWVGSTSRHLRSRHVRRARCLGRCWARPAPGVRRLWVLRRTGRSDLAVWLGAWAALPVRPGPARVLLPADVPGPVPHRYGSGVRDARSCGVGGCPSAAALGRRRCRRARHGDWPCPWYAPKAHGNWRGEDWREATRTSSREAARRRRRDRPVVGLPRRGVLRRTTERHLHGRLDLGPELVGEWSPSSPRTSVPRSALETTCWSRSASSDGA